MQTPAQVRCAWRAAARTGDFGIRQPKEDGAPEQSDQPEAKRRERRRVALSGAPERSRESGVGSDAKTRKPDDAGVPTSPAQYTERDGWEPRRGVLERCSPASSPLLITGRIFSSNFRNRTNGEKSPTPKEVENADYFNQGTRRECRA